MGGLRPPHCGTQRSRIPFHGTPPPSLGVRESDPRIQVLRWRSDQLQAQGYALSCRNPDHPKYAGFKNITALRHTEVCMYSALSGMVAGFARTKESESPGEPGPQAWVGFIGTVLSCKARRIQRRRVNGKAGIRATLQRTRRLRAEQGRHSHQTVSKPHGATVWGGL